jgi:hypothetical protein
VSPAGVDHRFMDISWLALDKAPPGLPFSLGFRTQALTLTRVSARTRGTFIRPAGFKASFPRDRKAKDHTGFTQDIGETRSLIFAPVYDRDGLLYDGVLDRSLGQGELPGGAGCRPEKETTILSGLCPDCGWDLAGQSDSLVLVCGNCHTLWQPRDDRLGRIRFGSALPENGDQVLIPFWRISAKGPGIKTAGDLKTLANLPRTGASEDQALFFWAPAFKIRPKVFLRISRQLTLAQPRPVLEKTVRPQTHLPITLPAGEAVQSIRVTLASLARPLKEHYSTIAGATFRTGAATLVYLPFDAQAHELMNRDLNLAINRNVLRLSSNL